jgi:putative hydrolase of the HAD superfamily
LNSSARMSTLAHTVMRIQIEAVVFDFGGVLTLQPLDSHLESIRALCGLDRPTFELEYRRQRRDYDRGIIDSREYWSRVMDSGGKSVDSAVLRSLYEEDVASWTRVNEPVLNWAFHLQEAGMRTGILSNMPRDILERIETRFRWFDRFEVKFFSCDIGVNKPEAEIYRACLDALRLEAGKVLFLDDIPENVRGAKRAGFRTVLFRNLEDSLQEISKQGWLPVQLTADQEHG